MFYIRFKKKLYWKNERIAHFLFFGERCEWIAQVAHQKWAMWANHSGRSQKMSNHERFTQVSQRKWAIVSKSLKLLTKKERMSESLIFFEQIAHSLTFGEKKRAIRWENRWANSQPWLAWRIVLCPVYQLAWKIALYPVYQLAWKIALCPVFQLAWKIALCPVYQLAWKIALCPVYQWTRKIANTTITKL